MHAGVAAAVVHQGAAADQNTDNAVASAGKSFETWILSRAGEYCGV